MSPLSAGTAPSSGIGAAGPTVSASQCAWASAFCGMNIAPPPAGGAPVGGAPIDGAPGGPPGGGAPIDGAPGDDLDYASETIPSRRWNEVIDDTMRGPREHVPKLNIDPQVLASEDDRFEGKAGARFKKLVEDAAAKVDLDPGLLAAAVLAEETRGEYTKKTGEQDSFLIGADDFLEKRPQIEKRVPAAKEIKVISASTDTNEHSRKVGTAHFDAKSAVLVDAVYLKYGELTVRDAFQAHGGDFDTLSPELRFAFTRLAMNPGKTPVAKQVENFLKTRDIADTAPGILIRTGVKTQDRGKPQSGATRVAGIGMHLSQKVFGREYDESSRALVPPKSPARPPD